MGNIQVLDISVANLIAAGEVVDRPASVVKELLENAIDANSTIITVEIKRGGVTYIRVTDNGCGMHRDDLPVAIQRHATSKIRDAKDLDSIITLGFRGEALAAISSVSTVRILSKRAEDKEGSYLLSKQGSVVEIGPSSAPDGTTITVEELFANVPARRKFLKSDTSESMAVCAVVEKIALSHPEISIRLIVDNNLKFSTSGDGKLQNTIYAVLGRDFSKRLIALEHQTEGIRIDGFVGAPDQVKSNRNYENFFINGRYIKSRTAMAALEQAFHSYIPSEKFPCCVLNIYLHPAFVDVNVHPTKLEVKFSNERMVFDAVYSAVRSAILQHEERPQLKFGQATSVSADDMRYTAAFVPIYDKMQSGASDEEVLTQMKIEDTAPQLLAPDEVAITPIPPIPATQPPKESPIVSVDMPTVTASLDPLGEQDYAQILNALPSIEQKHEESAPSAAPSTTEPIPPKATRPARVTPPHFQILGVAFHSYVFVEVEQTVLVIDKHAAHERILFEQLKENISLERPNSQILFMPLMISLDAESFGASIDYKTEIERLGFSYDCDTTKTCVLVKEIPLSLSMEQSTELLNELFSRMSSGTGNIALSREILYEQALYQASCKAAVKAGRIDDIEHIRWICNELLSLPDIKFCPHGRPVAFELSRQDLERQFKRT